MTRREDDPLYDVARKVTDEVMGAGTYAEINGGNPDPGVQAAIARAADDDGHGHSLWAHAFGGGFGIRVEGCAPCEASGEEPGTQFRVIAPPAPYRHTHASVQDNSPAMLVSQDAETITLINEDGYMWTDPLAQWRLIPPAKA